jgi:GxxExxY protein
MTDVKLKRDDLVYPELSYKIVGALFEVFRKIGSGYKEKYYQNAVSIALKNCGLRFKGQAPVAF